MKLIKLEHIGTDQHWQEETKIYWFDVEYFDCDDEPCYQQLGLSDTNGYLTVVDSDNVPLTEGDHGEIYFRRWLETYFIIWGSACTLHKLLDEIGA